MATKTKRKRSTLSKSDQARIKKAEAWRKTLPSIMSSGQFDLVAEFAPSLLPIAFSLEPFGDVIGGISAGPQPQSKWYDPDEPPHIDIDIDDPRYPGGDTQGESICCRITADEVTITHYLVTPDGERYADDTGITLEGLWSYLRQIPRPYHSF